MARGMHGQSKLLTISEVIERFPEVLNTGIQWLKVLKPGCHKGYRKKFNKDLNSSLFGSSCLQGVTT